MNKEKEPNYNERPDGYGSAGAESEHESFDYEKEREGSKKQTAPTEDENGLPNQHGEVDQYSFRNT